MKGKEGKARYLRALCAHDSPKDGHEQRELLQKAKYEHSEGTARYDSQETNHTKKLGVTPMTSGTKETRRWGGGVQRFG